MVTIYIYAKEYTVGPGYFTTSSPLAILVTIKNIYGVNKIPFLVGVL